MRTTDVAKPRSRHTQGPRTLTIVGTAASGGQAVTYNPWIVSTHFKLQGCRKRILSTGQAELSSDTSVRQVKHIDTVLERVEFGVGFRPT